jgi:hypothetical protein
MIVSQTPFFPLELSEKEPPEKKLDVIQKEKNNLSLESDKTATNRMWVLTDSNERVGSFSDSYWHTYSAVTLNLKGVTTTANTM